MAIFRKKPHILDIEYSTRRMLDLSDAELEECAKLFSSNYGKYNIHSPLRPGEQIRMSANRYRDNYKKEGRYIATARYQGKLIGHAIYIRKNYPSYGIMTWVLQLVVSREYRNNGIASILLESIWGFSDDFAWGLASANPCTVRTLENATFRRCKPAIVKKNLDAIKEIGKDTTFVEPDKYVVTNKMSQVDTAFFIDNSDYQRDTECEERLGKLRSGHEWLAFTFNSQSIQKDKFLKHFDKFVEFSEKKLREAYGRMQMTNHGWAQGTANESEWVSGFLKSGTVLDLGCGIGRHSIALAQKGFRVVGIDFAENQINVAKKQLNELANQGLECELIYKDIREIKYRNAFDNVIMLYDVIGSFPKDSDNKAMLEKARKAMVKGGVLIISVMNMELTESIIPKERQISVKDNPDVLLSLRPSNTMQSTGDIFNPEFLVLDGKEHLVYRKEQFGEDENLSAEYVIRDKRYRMDEITELVNSCGFKIVEKRYVRAGHFDEALKPTDSHAKEILIVAEKA